MPGVFAGPFPQWEMNHMAKRPSEARVKLLKKWVQNLINAEKVRRTGDPVLGPRCGVSPYYHFKDSDISLLKQIATDSGLFSDVNVMVSKMMEEYELAVKEHELLQKLQQCMAEQQAAVIRKDKLEALLANQHQTLAELKNSVDQQRQLQEQYLQEIQLMTALLEAEKDEVKKLVVKMNEEKHPPPEGFCDMIFTLNIMNEPVVAADGFTYEKEAILRWFEKHRTSPTTGALLPNKILIPNNSLRSQINQWKEKISGATNDSVGSAVGATIDKAVTTSVVGAADVAAIDSTVSAVGSAVGSVDNARSVGNACSVGNPRIVRRSSARRREDCVIC